MKTKKSPKRPVAPGPVYVPIAAEPTGAFLGPSAVAAMIGFSRVTLFNWIRAGHFPKGLQLFRESQRRYWRRADVQAWIDSRKPASFPPANGAAA